MGASWTPREDAKIYLFSHFHVAEKQQKTEQDFYPYYSGYMRRMFRGPIPAATYAHVLSPAGVFVGGSVQQMVDKIATLKRLRAPPAMLGKSTLVRHHSHR